MFSVATRNELKAKRDELRAQADLIDRLLKDDVGLAQRPTPQPGLSAATKNGDLAGLGLREAARKILESAPVGGLKPKWIAERMKALGFEDSPSATTDLITRVRNELWRMGKRGQLRSTRGFYSLKRETE
jgi:hypothetical protein